MEHDDKKILYLKLFYDSRDIWIILMVFNMTPFFKLQIYSCLVVQFIFTIFIFVISWKIKTFDSFNLKLKETLNMVVVIMMVVVYNKNNYVTNMLFIIIIISNILVQLVIVIVQVFV